MVAGPGEALDLGYTRSCRLGGGGWSWGLGRVSISDKKKESCKKKLITNAQIITQSACVTMGPNIERRERGFLKGQPSLRKSAFANFLRKQWNKREHC